VFYLSHDGHEIRHRFKNAGADWESGNTGTRYAADGGGARFLGVSVATMGVGHLDLLYTRPGVVGVVHKWWMGAQ
jgi:hypothetical protein